MSDNTKSTTPPVLRTDTFDCVRCGLTVTTFSPDGERRNHCPSCLYSRHLVDQAAGGPSDCGARMAPISIAVLRDGRWAVIHRCVRCHELTSSPVCVDDNQLVLMRTAVRPLAQPPFPLEAFGDL
ncbi:RNHCP domain-containing protein [Streptomyces durbertensis]|uniref:RNHCP domain-containing protein n=1 Tax=Streptomyces durbertensis TaxID=2448886 RepID=A0ABR6ELM0_9ACTN|nr:RNHCP domain-containing protein [Streptomyces durbertensis]MBB1246207.1 RNHCP domain-containing protein [Streptomyces durbertensis]